MPRTSFRPVAAVGLVAALLAYVGCTSDKLDPDSAVVTPAPGAAEDQPAGKAAPAPSAPAEAPPAPAPAETPGEAAAPSPSKGPFAGWPSPAGALVLTGEQLGYLEPCGCTAGQLGGLLRRYNLVHWLAGEKKWPLALMDLGSLIKDPASARGGPEQTKIKFHAALKALTTLNYDALALSPEDLKVGVDEAVGQFLNLPGDKLKVVAANVEAAGLGAKVVPSVRATLGNVKVGITAVVAPEALQALKDPSLDLLTPKPIDPGLGSVLADLEKDTQTQVLLIQAPPAEAKAVAAKYPGFDVVVATGGLTDPPDDAERINDGKTMLVNVGQKGKYVVVVGVFPGAETPYRYQRVMLDPKFDGDAGPMKKVIEDEYRETLKAQKVVENFPRHDYVNGAKGATFVGAETCKGCHPNTVTYWASTKHAKAFESLLGDPKPNVIYDVECVTCHTTGFEYNSGYKSPELTSYLKGNQCENCHGPASKHAAAPDDKDARALVHLTAEQADKNRLCLRCHDEDNSPHFTFPEYWGKIAHKGLDTYNDPKVHQGVPASSPPTAK